MSAVANHPNRSKRNRSVWSNPFPHEIRAMREHAGLTQTQAAELIYGTLRAWQNWEAEKDAPDHRQMHAGLWELFQLKTAHRRGDPGYIDTVLGGDAGREQ